MSKLSEKAGAGPLFLFLAVIALPLYAEDMKPNKEPVPSPSDLAVEQPRVDGDRPTDAIPRNPAAGGTRPIPENNRGEPITAPGR